MFSLCSSERFSRTAMSAFDEQPDDEHLEREEGDVVQQIEEEVAGVAEDGVVDGVEDDRGRQTSPAPRSRSQRRLAAAQRAISTETLA